MTSIGARRLPTVVVSGSSQRDLTTYLRGHAASLQAINLPAAPVPLLDEPEPKRPRWLRLHAQRG